MKYLSLLSIILYTFIIGCNTDIICKPNLIKEDVTIRDNLDTLIRSEYINCDTIINVDVNKNKDTLLFRKIYQDSCVFSQGSYVSLVHFYQEEKKVFIPSVYLVPDSGNTIKYEIFMSIVNLKNDEVIRVGPLKVNSDFITGYKFNFKEGGEYKWIMDVYVDDIYKDYIVYNRDSLMFSMDSFEYELGGENKIFE